MAMRDIVWTWQKISGIVATVVGIFAIIGGVFGAQDYMEEKYAEAEDIEAVMMMVASESEEVQQLVAMNARSIQLNQYRLEQKIIEDRIDRKRDLKQEVEMIQPETSKEHDFKVRQLNSIENDIEDLEEDLEKIDKPE